MTISIDHLSHSSITTFTGCPRRWHYDKVVLAPRERTAASLAFGTAVHEAVAEVNEAAMVGASVDVRTAFSSAWRSHVEETATEVALEADGAEQLYTTGITLLEAYRPPPRIVGVEQPFRIELAPDLPPVEGRIDLLRQDEDGSLIIADVKTSSTRMLTDTCAIEAQLGLYDVVYPARRHEAIVLAKVKAATISVQAIVPWQVDRLSRHYRDVYQAMTAGVRYAVRGRQCGTCPFRDRCARDG